MTWGLSGSDLSSTPCHQEGQHQGGPLCHLTPSLSPGSPSADLIRGTIRSGVTVEDLILTGINYLDARSSFWQQQKPIYARERDRKLMRDRWLRDRGRTPAQTAHYVLKSLEDIDMRVCARPA